MPGELLRMIDLHDGEIESDNLHGLICRNETFTDAHFIDCIFDECDFTEASFHNCRFVDCSFRKCDLSMVQLNGSTFRDTTFVDSRLDGIDWSRVSWPQTSFNAPVSFQRCSLSHSTFIGLSLPELKLIECRCMNTDFRQASLQRSIFRHTDFAESLFQGTRLTEVDFTGARNNLIDTSQNDITGAKFQLPEAMELLYAMEIEISE